MKVKMIENYQGSGVSALELPEEIEVSILRPGKEYEVSDARGAWLIEHGKAEEVKAKHYGAKSEPEPRNDDEIYEEVKKEVELPIMSTQSQAKPAAKKPPKRARPKRGSGKK